MPIDCRNLDSRIGRRIKSEVLLTQSTRSAKSSLPKKRFAPVTQLSSNMDRQHAIATIPIVPK